MPVDRPVPREDTEFLALLVHRGWLPRADAEGVLAAAGEAGLDAALAGLEGWDVKRVQW